MGGVYHFHVVATSNFIPEIGKVSQNINDKDIKQLHLMQYLLSAICFIKYSQSRVDALMI